MPIFRRILLAFVVAAAATGSSAADARHYSSAESAAVYVCGPLPASTWLYIYPTANWEPFFRRHVYRFGPIVACETSAANSSAISVRY
jgi:hypothetical protein